MSSQLEKRTELSHRLKAILRDVGRPSFGPEIPGCLLKFRYYPKEHDLERAMASEELRALLGISSKEDDEKRFLTLVYLEGRKYTFGKKYKSRRSQGDFVPLDLDMDLDDFNRNRRVENYFSLLCQDGALWIRVHVQKGFSVSINGVPLWREWDLTFDLQRPLQRKLEFGDITTLSTRDWKSVVDFLFKASVVKVQTEAGAKEANQGPFLLINPLILENVLHFLPTTLVQGLRSVSQNWNTGGLKSLRNRVVLTIFDFEKCHHDQSAEAGIQISDFAHSQLNFPIWKIALSPQQNYGRRPDPKIVDDLKWLLLDGPFHNVTSLSLSCNVEGKWYVQMFEMILDALRGSLRTLFLEVHTYYDVLVPTLKPMNHLKTLSLSSRNSHYTKAFLFMQAFLPAMRHIQTLYLPDGFTWSESSGNRTILEEIAKIQSLSEGGFGGLKHIRINRTMDSQLEGLVSLRAGSLKTLELRELDPAFRQTLHGVNGYQKMDLRSVLERHIDSIQELTLHFSPSNYADVPVTLAINFPWRMINLTSLSVFFSLTMPYSANYRFTFGFEDINYNRRFPNLSKLTVWPVDREDLSSGSQVVRSLDNTPWESFLPALMAFVQPNRFDEDGNIAYGRVRSVQSVDIPFVLMGKYHRVLDGLEATFPNVEWPPELVTARQGPVETDE